MKDCDAPKSKYDSPESVVTSDPPLDTFLFSLQQELGRDKLAEAVCKRCKDLNFAELFRLPFQSEYPDGLKGSLSPPLYGESLDIVARLGRADGIEFLSNCPLCKLLISTALRFTPATWTEVQILRVAAPFLTTMQCPDNVPDIRSMLARLNITSSQQPSLFLTGTGTTPSIHPLGVRMGISLHPKGGSGGSAAQACELVGPRPDFSLIKSWIDNCEQSHSNCRHVVDKSILKDIRLVDIVQRTVVPYDIEHEPDYVALSYVWGGVKQDGVALNTPLPQLPQTVEDAMVVVRELGKRYLWVDALCIDQDDGDHKARQIAIMGQIYHNACATIINLTGTSSSSGLPRVSGDRYISQLYFRA